MQNIHPAPPYLNMQKNIMGRGVAFWIWFCHGIGLVCMGMFVVKAGASLKTKLGGGRTSYPEVGW